MTQLHRFIYSRFPNSTLLLYSRVHLNSEHLPFDLTWNFSLELLGSMLLHCKSSFLFFNFFPSFIHILHSCPRWLYTAFQLEPWCGGVFCFGFWLVGFWYCSYLWWSMHPTCNFFYLMFRWCTCIRKINADYFSQYVCYSYMINSY